MSPLAPKVSVIVAAYQPGNAVNHVIDSLDAQTLPQDQFESIFVDDGSPDDTFDRLDGLAASRPNMQVYRTLNSGWPSRPRNLGVSWARGEYVVFMDHDDALYPDALRRAVEYAEQNDADIVNVLEFNTKNVWWMPSFAGNIANVIGHGGIQHLMPFMPHKLYRRRVLIDNDIKFPERPRALWEDWYVNVGAYRHSKVVSVLADTPFYLRHIHATNASHTFDAQTEDYWDRLDDIMRYIVTTLDGDDYRSDRTVALARHLIMRVIDPIGTLVSRAKPRIVQRSFARARQLLLEYGTDETTALMSKTHKAQAELLRADRPDLTRNYHAADSLQRVRASATDVRWDDSKLVANLECVWESPPGTPFLRREGDRVLRLVGEDVAPELSPELVDVSDDAGRFAVKFRLRNRRDFIGVDLPVKLSRPAYEEDENGVLSIVARGTMTIDLATAASGRPLTADVWDLLARATWLGLGRPVAVSYAGKPLPMVNDENVAVAYANNSKGLSLDLAQQLRTFAIDANPRSGPAGTIHAYAAPLDNVSVFGRREFAADSLFLVPDVARAGTATAADGQDAPTALETAVPMNARVVADRAGVMLAGSTELPPGSYAIYVTINEKMRRTKRTLFVDDDSNVSFG